MNVLTKLLAASWFLLFAFSAPASDWVSMGEKNGVKLFKKAIPGSKVVSFRGETEVSASMEKLMYVLLDNEHRTEWVDRLYMSDFLDNKTPYEYTLYQRFKLPWPIAHRDFVYKGKATRQVKGGPVRLELHSVENKDAPGTIGVRAELMTSAYVITPGQNGRTHISVEIHSDPKGMLPTWLVNLLQKSWPEKTLAAISRQVQKAYVKPLTLPPLG